MRSIIDRMKTDKVGTQNSLYDLLLPNIWHQPNDFVSRKRYMKKKADANSWYFLSYHFCQWKQMIIMNPDNIVAPCILTNNIEKASIYFYIIIKVITVELDIRWKIVKQWP